MNDAPQEAPDRSTSIRVFGVIQIVLGALAALMAPLAVLGSLMGSEQVPGMPARMQVGSALGGAAVYGGIGAVLIWSGIGSVMRRRWAGAVALVLFSLWLVMGVLGMAAVTVILPDTMEGVTRQMQASGQPVSPATLAAVEAIVTVVTFFFTGVIYVVLPGALTFFYSRKSVRQTFARRDPAPAWTDACPLPVLALSALCLLGALGCIIGLVVGGIAPVFGFVLTGLPAVLVFLASGAVFAACAVGLYRLSLAAWWATLAVHLFWGASTAVTFSRLSMTDLYVRMGVSGEQLEMMSRMGSTTSLMPWFGAVWAAAVIGYQIYLLRFFRRPTAP